MDDRKEKDDLTPVPRGHTVEAKVSGGPTLAVLSYCASSILMTVLNKYVFSGSHFNLNFFLLGAQSIICLAAISALKHANLISYRDFSVSEAKSWFPISALLVLMIYTSSKALAHLSIPIYTIFKNLAIICIAYGEVLWFGGRVSGMALLSFGLMVLSSVIAAWDDVGRALALRSGSATTAVKASGFGMVDVGYVWMALNCFSNAFYVLAMRKRIKVTKFKDFDTMFYNNLLSIPILFLSSLVLETWTPQNLLLNFPTQSRNTIITAIIISGLSSIFISYTSAWCVRVTSSTTYSMVGALNKLPLAVSGFLFFDVEVTGGGVVAVGVGFLSGLVYAWAKVLEKRVGGLPVSVGKS